MIKTRRTRIRAAVYCIGQNGNDGSYFAGSGVSTPLGYSDPWRYCSFFDIDTTGMDFPADIVVTKAYLEVWMTDLDSASDPIGPIEIVTAATSGATNSVRWISAMYNPAPLVTVELHGNEKRKHVIDLGETAAGYFGEVYAGSPFSIAMRAGVTGMAQTLGEGMDADQAAAIAPVVSAPVDAPHIILEWHSETLDSDPIKFNMVYTTEDPTSPQLTPVNSIGAYAAENSVYTENQIASGFGVGDTSIQLLEPGELPATNSGLVACGPEVVRYNKRSGSLLYDLTRGLSGGQLPASMSPANQYVQFLDVDRLFDTRPASGLMQYRCVAMKLFTPTPVKNIDLLLCQNPTSDAQIDIGIELPSFDCRTGTTTGTTTGNFFTSSTAAVVGLAADYFVGGHVIVDLSGTPVETIITGYESDGLSATFQTDDYLSLTPGRSFRINPAPGYRSPNDASPPTGPGFLGFFSEGGNQTVTLSEHGNRMVQNDLFYVWIRRTLPDKSNKKSATGAIIAIRAQLTS